MRALRKLLAGQDKPLHFDSLSRVQGKPYKSASLVLIIEAAPDSFARFV